MKRKNVSITITLLVTSLLFYGSFLRGEEEIVFEDVLNPDGVFVDGDQVFVSEADVISVYSLTSRKKLYQLTNKGEGPNEFLSSPLLTFFPETIAATGEGKIIFYKRDGKIIEEKRVPLNMRMFPIMDHYISSRDEMDPKSKRYIRKNAIYNANFQLMKEIGDFVPESMIVISSDGKISKQNYYMIAHGNGFITDGRHICLYNSRKGFFIEIYDHKGKKNSVINKNFSKVIVSNAYKDKRLAAMKKDPNWGQLNKMFNFVFPEFIPAFRRVYINEGLIYVLTDTLEDDIQTLMVLDFSGKVLTTSKMPNLECRCFYKGRLYYFKESQDEKWVLHVQKLI